MEQVTQEYLLGGGMFTVCLPSELAGKHSPFRSYRVDHVPAHDSYPESWFVRTPRVHKAPAEWLYVGRLDDYTGQVSLTRASRVRPGDFALRLLNRLLARLWSGDHETIRRFGFRLYRGWRERVAREVPVRSRRKRKPSLVEASGNGTTGAVPEPTLIKSESFDLSDRPGFPVNWLRPQTDREGETTLWYGYLEGVYYTVYND